MSETTQNVFFSFSKSTAKAFAACLADEPADARRKSPPRGTVDGRTLSGDYVFLFSFFLFFLVCSYVSIYFSIYFCYFSEFSVLFFTFFFFFRHVIAAKL